MQHGVCENRFNLNFNDSILFYFRNYLPIIKKCSMNGNELIYSQFENCILFLLIALRRNWLSTYRYVTKLKSADSIIIHFFITSHVLGIYKLRMRNDFARSLLHLVIRVIIVK